MNVTCPNCATVYRVDPAKVPEGGVRARCNICSAVFAVRRDGEAQDRAAPVAAGMPASPPPVPVAPLMLMLASVTAGSMLSTVVVSTRSYVPHLLERSGAIDLPYAPSRVARRSEVIDEVR